MLLLLASVLTASGCATDSSNQVMTAESLEETYDALLLNGDNLQNKECVLKNANAIVLEDAGSNHEVVGPKLKTNAANSIDGSAIATRSYNMVFELTPEYYVKLANAICKETAEKNVGS